MHEYSVAAELVNALLPQVAAVDGQIVGVILKKGEMRILSDHSLISAFEMVSEGTPLQGARLIIELVPVSVSCLTCGYQGAVEHVSDDAFHFSVPILTCPKCQSEVEMKTGRELYVDRLTVRTPMDTDGG
ncbi:hydrogenase maturation nickel metallochaperone HypA [Candidatus Bipolaricaulota bacterium]|nr:hydrogenase maturation nickel metallochaperone HypA [Candidatus Bipolaricaulota bacterium]